MKRSYLLNLLFISFLLLLQLGTSAQVNVAIQILPPYPTKFTDYASRPHQMIISLTNISTTQQRVQLRGVVNGDNGISIRTKAGYKSPSAIELAAGQTRSLNGSDLASFFDHTDLEYSGITQTEFIQKGGLPEGRYQLCIRAFDYDSNSPVSSEEPGGCSNSFTISSLEPPVIMSPMDEQSVPSGPGQVFSIRWNTPPSTPPGIQYRIRMVEILGNRNPNDAIMTATQPYFFEKEVMTNMYIYNPADPQLTVGRRYALMVEAFDPFNNAVFRNNGRSEVIFFEYGANPLTDTTEVIETVPAVVVTTKKEKISIDAKMVYRYDGTTQNYPYSGKVYLYKEDELVGSGDANENGDLKMIFDIDSLEGMYTTKYNIRLANPYLSNPKQSISFSANSTNLGELTAIPYAYNLEAEIKKGYAQKANNQVGSVSVNQSLAGLRAVLYRKTKDSGIPLYEASKKVGSAATAGQMIIVAEDTTRIVNVQGKPTSIARFSNLLISKSASDTYYIAVYKAGSTTEKLIDEPFKFETSSYRHKMTRPGYQLEAIQSANTGTTSEKINDNRYNVKTTLTWVTTDPPLAKLKGRILYRYKDGVGGARPLANKNIKLIPVYVLSDPITRKQYIMSGNTSIVPVGSNNQQLAGEPEKSFKDLPKMNGDVNGVAGTTLSDGSFTMNEIPLWDSVQTFTGLYNIKKPIIPFIPPQNEVVVEPDNPFAVNPNQSKDWRINPADQFAGVFNPVGGYSTNPGTTGLVGGGISVLNSPAVVVGGVKSNVINNQVNTITGSGLKVSAPKVNQRGPAIGDEMPEASAAQDEFISSNPLTLVRCYRVVIDDWHHLSPENNIFINPLETVDAGTLYSDVKSYKLRVTVKAADDKKKLSNVKLSLRKSSQNPIMGTVTTFRPVPEGELERNPASNFPEKGKSEDPYSITLDQLYSQVDSNRNIFSHLVFFEGNSYYVAASTNDSTNSLISYSKISRQVGDPWGESRLAVYNNEYEEPTHDITIMMQPKNPVVAGRLLNQDGTRGINGDGCRVFIIKSDRTSTLLPVDKDGYFVYASPDATAGGNGWQIAFTANGYNFDRSASPPSNSTVTINGQTFTSFMVSVNDNVTQNNGWTYLNFPELKKGQKIFKNLYFKPQSQIKGFVADANGKPVPALYKVEGAGLLEETKGMCTVTARAPDGRMVTTTVPDTSPLAGNKSSNCKQEFNAGVASGKPAQIVIIPNDLKYFNDTLKVTNPAIGITNVGTRTMITREHRIVFYVWGRRKNGQRVPIPNATIKVLDSTMTTTATGMLKYQFANISQKNFWLKITPPTGSTFVPKEETMRSEERKDFRVYNIELTEGDAIWGKVTLAGNPVPNAEVSVSQGVGSASIMAKTAADGTYRIPAIKTIDGATSEVTVSVSAGNQANGTFIAGQQKKTAVNTETNFELSSYNELDVSRLLGYQVKVTALVKENNKTYLSGELVMPSNAEFKTLDESIKLTFTKVAIKANTQNKRNASGQLYAEPEEDIKLDNPNFTTRLGGSYNVLVGNAPPTSLRDRRLTAADGYNGQFAVKKLGPLKGALNAKARIWDNSFNFTESYLSFSDSQFYLAEKTGNTFNHTLLLNPTSGTEYDNTTQPAQAHTWHFANASGQALSFKFLGFSATSAVEQNFYTNGKIRIKPTITAAVETPDDKPLVINMPEIFFSSEKVEGVNSNQPIEFNLENWTVRVSKWKVAAEEGGILSLDNSENYVRTTAGVNVAFKSFRLRNDELLIDNVNLSTLKLGGIKDLQINAGNVVFGLDNRTGNDLRKHYVLRLLGQNGRTAGSIGGLPGFTQALDLEAITLISNGEQYVDFATNSSTVKVYNVMNFTPIALEASQGGFRLAGNVDLGIPNLPVQYGGFLYTAGATPNSLKSQFDVKDLKLDIGKGYVEFVSLANPEEDNGKKIISQNRLEIWGTVTEPGKLAKIPVKLTKVINGQQVAINIEQRPAIFAMQMGGDAKMILNVSRTWTKVENNAWDYLQFTGKFDEKYQGGGMGADPYTFKVFGEISLEERSVSVKDIKTPLGNMNLVFDWQKKEMRGTLEIQTADGKAVAIPGGISFLGSAEVLIGTKGFYFVLAGDINVNSVPLIFPLSAGILIAYHDNVPKEVFDRTSQYMYHKTYPCGVENGGSFKGFMIAGRKNVIDPVDFSMDIFGVASATVSLEVGFDATFYGNFSNGLEISFTPGVFGDVSLVASSALACVELEAKMKLSAMGNFLAQVRDGDATFTGALCMSLLLEGKLLQKIPALPPICTNEVLIDFDEGFTIGAMFGLRASTANGGKIEPFFKVIKSPCSENMNLLCNKTL
jgi:TANFOR domain-containing protein